MPSNSINSQESFLVEGGSVQHFMPRQEYGGAAFSLRWIPDAVTFAVAITLLVLLGAWTHTDHGPVELMDYWYVGFWLLPLLGITGLKVGQVLGYTMILMAAVFLIKAGCLLLLL